MKRTLLVFLPEIVAVAAFILFSIYHWHLLPLSDAAQNTVANLASALAGAWISIRILNWLVDLRLRGDAYQRLIIQFLGDFHDHLAKLPPGYRKHDLRGLRFELQEFRRRTGRQRQHFDSTEQNILDRVVKDLSAAVAEIERFDNAKGRAAHYADDVRNTHWLPKQEAEKLVDANNPQGETVGAFYAGEYFNILEKNDVLRSVGQQYSAILTDPLYEKSSTTYENDIRYISDLKQNLTVLELPARLEATIRNYLDAVFEAGLLRYELDRRLERLGEQIYRAKFNIFQDTE
jgi:hypothetical protein